MEKSSNSILVTGGAGFIGSNFVIEWLAKKRRPLIINLDKLTYAGNFDSLEELRKNPKHIFIHGDILDRSLLFQILSQYKPQAIIHFAAETHVDRSILAPNNFIQTNIVGTFHLLEEARAYWQKLAEVDKKIFRLLHVSTDEVYGSLSADALPANEAVAYAPNSPYAASKAASDHLARSYFQTYGLPTIITNCSNNYGPRQFPEKFIPVLILNALQGKPLPVYGDGKNIRDWLYVTDHCRALCAILKQGRPGETYNIGSGQEKTNLQVVEEVCTVLDELFPASVCKPHQQLLQFVKDRAGHDRRYALDAGKVFREIGWQPQEFFRTGLLKTIQWYIENTQWLENVTSGNYQEWIALNYLQREANVT